MGFPATPDDEPRGSAQTGARDDGDAGSDARSTSWPAATGTGERPEPRLPLDPSSPVPSASAVYLLLVLSNTQTQLPLHACLPLYVFALLPES